MRVRPSGITALLLAVVFAMLSTTATASAAAREDKSCPSAKIPEKDDVISIVGQLSDTSTTPCTPVEGVKIIVEDAEGAVIGEGVSTADGTFSIPLPGPAIDNLGTTVTVKLDEDSLPEGSVLT
ncbi:MAG: hypothetical protein H0V49_04330, partial [Nocardioidaceae bacterium]|nr:hypothetical protein [Nocardioidaceae bacterium]